MTPNVGLLDLVLRIAVGAALLFLASVGSIGPWGYIGVVPFLTGVFRYCPLYGFLGFKTCPAAENRR
ncbi:DUF2892 domain-containing protein [Ramlibacter sp.]|uniref:YgaP family membrane protein n=1 Tax=Ramlibacter sp. TaxID=1917967 RepID=UPI002626E6E8|nr:DUF2892 domain-containing protein [Ramlibacter sp.]MDB5953680.1 hypothetical protein [Ramlibacter sp.]